MLSGNDWQFTGDNGCRTLESTTSIPYNTAIKRRRMGSLNTSEIPCLFAHSPQESYGNPDFSACSTGHSIALPVLSPPCVVPTSSSGKLFTPKA